MVGVPVSHLRIYSREERYIVYNPTVPSWVHTNVTGALLVKLLSLLGSVAESINAAARNGIDKDSSQDFFSKMHNARMFEVADKSMRWTEQYKKNRQLSSVYLHLTNTCNLSCSYCYRNSSPKVATKYFGDAFNSFLSECAPILSKSPKITFSGGEPLMHPDFRSVVEHAGSLGFSCQLLTNGMLIDDEFASWLVDRFAYIKISLDGATEQTHAKTRGVGSFSSALRGLERLAHAKSAAESKVVLQAQVTMNTTNMAEAKHLRAQLPSGVSIRVTPLMPMGRGVTEGEYLSSDEFYEVSSDLSGGMTETSLINGQRTFGCYAGEAHISVSDSGDVYPCHLFHKSTFRMGNIFRNDVSDIFYGEKMTEFASSMDVEVNNSRCSSCDFRYLCGGGCKANPLHAKGNYRSSDTYCGFIRKSLVDELFASAPLV